MASTTTYSDVVEITLMTEDTSETVFKINNPKENLTRAMVTAVYNPAIAAGIIFDRNYAPFTTVGKIEVVQTTVRRADVT